MQKNHKNKEHGVIYSAVVLLLITGLVACLVAVVNYVTKPVIEKHDAERVAENIDLIFEGNSGFDDITGSCADKGLLKGADGVTAVYEVKRSDGGENCYCVKSKASGYGGDVEVLVGFDCDGLVSGMRLLSLAGETPGVGQRIKEDSFLKRFSGLNPQSGGEVEGISGATVSSTAAVKAVNSACVAVGNILGKPVSGNPKGQSADEQSTDEQSADAQSGATGHAAKSKPSDTEVSK